MKSIWDLPELLMFNASNWPGLKHALIFSFQMAIKILWKSLYDHLFSRVHGCLSQWKYQDVTKHPNVKAGHYRGAPFLLGIIIL